MRGGKVSRDRDVSVHRWINCITLAPVFQLTVSAGGLLQTRDTATVDYLRTRETRVIIRSEVVHGGLTEDLRAMQEMHGGVKPSVSL